MFQQKENLNVPGNEIIILNYPNPFNLSTQVKYWIPSEDKISIVVYNILGKEIVVLENVAFKKMGWHTVNWNGTDINGNPVPSGVYICHITGETQTNAIKLMLLR